MMRAARVNEARMQAASMSTGAQAKEAGEEAGEEQEEQEDGDYDEAADFLGAFDTSSDEDED